ncbi:Zinc finger AN1 domain-containing stress-associated protein 12 [Ananas comosus]|uniref:Zinc finger AN1 domain-containing stress-associated protein 12 n=1 Tax=Ananas comosus TaxID=4615 RepID=A0A199UIV9_ANACO|nr:Zinc finger AN1 domain-containing stress-associated protein 12 [Ananas comosus]
MGRGTEAFPDLGAHCEHEDCNQLDFLPFTCDGCQKAFCLEHRTYKSHGCPGSEHRSRTVVVCEICSASVEREGGGEDDVAALERHVRSGACDPARKRKPRCPVPRCREALTFSNTATCRACHVSVCLRHRFPSDHACAPRVPVTLPARNGIECGDRKARVRSPPSVKAY